MTWHGAAVLFAAAALVGTCSLADDRAEQTRSTTTTRRSSADRAELRAELEWLLSPTRPCPPPARLGAPRLTEPIASMLLLLGVEPTPAARCTEGAK